jgi:hypothetical protein
MNHRILQSLLCLLILIALGCGASSNNHPPLASTQAQPSATPEPNTTPTKVSDTDSGDIDSIYSEDNALSYDGYEVVRRSRTVKFRGVKYDTEILYAVLKKNGKVLATFDGLSYPLGVEVRFGLFPLLGESSKQLIVEQSTYRGWRYWVVNLSPNFSILYDSVNYDVGGLRALDLDKDGRYELIHTLNSFGFFNKLDNTNSPFIDIVFKYNPRTQTYIPANPEFQDFALKDIEQKIKKAREVVATDDSGNYYRSLLSAVLEVSLRYIYAGKEKEGWSFYEEYNAPDKDEVKSELKKVLNKDSVYKSIHGKRAT